VGVHHRDGFPPLHYTRRKIPFIAAKKSVIVSDDFCDTIGANSISLEDMTLSARVRIAGSPITGFFPGSFSKPSAVSFYIIDFVLVATQ